MILQPEKGRPSQSAHYHHSFQGNESPCVDADHKIVNSKPCEIGIRDIDDDDAVDEERDGDTNEKSHFNSISRLSS